VFVSTLGLLGHPATQPLINNLGALAPGPAKDIATSALRNLQNSQGAAGVLFFVGLAIALWSASSYIGAFTRAANEIYEVAEGRPFWKLRPVQLAITLGAVLMLVVVALGVVLTGSLAEEVGRVLGVGSAAVTAWDIAKWPVILLIVITSLALLYYLAPNVKQPKFRWLTPGGVLAALLWIAASAGFAFYVAHFSSYNETYGALGSVIVFLVWLWISNLAVLFGAELNAELERERELVAGVPGAEEGIKLPPRDVPKDD
jgi:membrane protein